ncbi:TfoX/Sxy family protein [Hyphococcus sp. DH-69]|uniref:TfoX/Sxy family protein n=1 Tax=Hyphococcus formosus TaxID=3143534 RepID=UPI00398AC513
MTVSSSYLSHLKDLFAPFGEITIRKMFGGAGIYCDGNIFAITGEDGLWLKADDVSRAEFENAGCERFTYEFENGKTGSMSYYSVPEEVFDDSDALEHWTQLALGAASRSIKKPKKSAKKR